MPYFQHHDIMCELIELGQNLIDELSQELSYYHASVYKSEESQVIKEKISYLKLVCDLIDQDTLREIFFDYQAALDTNQIAVPGICRFSANVAQLIKNLRRGFEQSFAMTNQSLNTEMGFGPEFSQIIKENQELLLSMCRPTSKNWSFFRTLLPNNRHSKFYP